MGQLEKYGLYVLCLVIFLILGVTIWGGGEVPPSGRRLAQPPASDLKAGLTNPASNPAAGRAPTTAPDLGALLRPRADDPKVPAKPTDPKKEEAKPVDASGKPAGAGDAQPAVGAGVKPAGVDAGRPTHKVKSGDSFETIAKQRLGNPALRVEIARLNPRVEPNRVQIGQELLLPTAAEVEQFLARSKPAAAPVAKDAGTKTDSAKQPAAKVASTSGYHTIVKGDTLEGIAQRELGSRKRVNELKELNPSVDPTQLRLGQRIKLPQK